MIDAIKSVWHFIKDYSAVIILAVLLILFVFYMVTPIAKVDNDGLVIAFIGVLATFVVIGNFAQTTAIKTDIETKLSQLTPQIGDAIKIAEANKNDIKTITTNTETNTKDIAKLQTSVNTLVLNDTITHSDLAQFFSLFTGEQHDILKTMRLLGKMTDPESIYNISMMDGRKDMVKFTTSEDNEPILVRQNGSPVEIEDIVKISGIQFDWSQIKYAYKLLRHIPYADFQEDGQTTPTQEQISTDSEDQTEKTK